MRRDIERDLKYVWHPFTQHALWPRDILMITRARGVWLYDDRGRRYFDAVSSLWCNVHGHRVPHIDRAILMQLRRVAHSTYLGLAHEPGARLAERLARIAPRGLTRVFYSDSGSAAVEVALKMALQYWRQNGAPRRTRFVALRNAYHGDTIGAVSVGGIELFHSRFGPLLFPAYRAPAPHPYRCPRAGDCVAHCLETIERIARRHRDRIAAVIVEPRVQAAAGIIVHPPGFLRGVREICDRYDLLLIADEVATGFGRTGKMFACDTEGVRPDLMAVGKGLTGGYLPLSATLATERIFRGFLGSFGSGRTFYHGHTYAANPLACAAALANLDLFERNRVLDRLPAKIGVFHAELNALRDLPHVGDVRALGLIAGIELVRDKARKIPFPYGRRTAHRVVLAARRRGILMRPLGDVLVLFPPLASTQRHLRFLVRAVGDSIREVFGTSRRWIAPAHRIH